MKNECNAVTGKCDCDTFDENYVGQKCEEESKYYIYITCDTHIPNSLELLPQTFFLSGTDILIKYENEHFDSKFDETLKVKDYNAVILSREHYDMIKTHYNHNNDHTKRIQLILKNSFGITGM